MYPQDPHSLQQLGETAARLLSSGPHWIRRRKEKLTLLDETTVRRQMSVDFALPGADGPMQHWGGTPVFYAPLFFLQKGSDKPFDPDARLEDPEPHFANFDLRDGTGKAQSLPPRTWNGMVSAEMLWAVARDAADYQRIRIAGQHYPGARGLLADICSTDQLRAVGLVDQLRDSDAPTPEERLLRELDRRDATLRRLLDACAIASVVIVPLFGSDARRGIVKLSYDEQVADLRPRRGRRLLAGLGLFGYELWVDTPYIGAGNYHFEIQAPEGLEIYDAGLVRVGLRRLYAAAPPNYRAELARSSGFGTRLHLYVPSAARAAKAFAWIRFHVRRQEFIGGALGASVAVMLVLWGAWFVREDAREAPVSVPTLLLLFPSAVAAYAARPNPHRLTARMLRGARWLLEISAALPFVAATAFALARRRNGQVVDDTFADWWLAAAIVATVIAAVLLLGREFPQPRIRLQRLADRLGMDLDRPHRPPHPEPLLPRLKRHPAYRRLRRRAEAIRGKLRRPHMPRWRR
jgi:hypothetical protein